MCQDSVFEAHGPRLIESLRGNARLYGVEFLLDDDGTIESDLKLNFRAREGLAEAPAALLVEAQ